MGQLTSLPRQTGISVGFNLLYERCGQRHIVEFAGLFLSLLQRQSEKIKRLL
jgi:hypothetical protein